MPAFDRRRTLSQAFSSQAATMTPLAAAHYAHRACHQRVTIVDNRQIARDTYRVRFDAPEIARRIVPGQFLMLRWPAATIRCWAGRWRCMTPCQPTTVAPRVGIDVVYLVVGKMTRRLAGHRPAGQALEVWGPLGNGFPPQTANTW